MQIDIFIETLKSSLKRKLPYVAIYSSIKEFKESKWFEMSFDVGYMIHLRTIYFFSNWFQLMQSQCNNEIYKIT